MKIKELINAFPYLKKLFSQDLSIPTLYKLSSMADKLERHLHFYEVQRNELFKKYCEFKNDQYVPLPGKDEELTAKIQELIEIEIDDEIVSVGIPLSENIKLSCTDINALRNFIYLGDSDGNRNTDSGS